MELNEWQKTARKLINEYADASEERRVEIAERSLKKILPSPWK